jgi:hypothetical protein
LKIHFNIIHISNLISVFHCFVCTEGSHWFRGFFECGVTWFFYGKEPLALRPTPKPVDHLLSAVRDCLFNIFAATLHIWKPFLHPQPEDAPLITVTGAQLSRFEYTFK